ncbi:hypothetical protein EDD85DRAFT_950483 [Armillaria nabsnona]|nr:hypothetical protein EDD85DRAFT_950483 [Armillaria nabsnona]
MSAYCLHPGRVAPRHQYRSLKPGGYINQTDKRGVVVYDDFDGGSWLRRTSTRSIHWLALQTQLCDRLDLVGRTVSTPYAMFPIHRLHTMLVTAAPLSFYLRPTVVCLMHSSSTSVYVRLGTTEVGKEISNKIEAANQQGHDWRSCYVNLLTRSSGGHGISRLSTTETLSIVVSMICYLDITETEKWSEDHEDPEVSITSSSDTSGDQ